MPTTNLRASAHAILAAGIFIGAALGIPAGAIISSAPAIAAPAGCYEDDTSGCIDQTWVCWRDGNRVCPAAPAPWAYKFIPVDGYDNPGTAA